MNDCCNFYGKFLLAAFALFLSLGSLQAQTQPNCDLSKCSPEERALCAKICAGANATTASLLNVLSPTTTVAKANCKPTANCKPSDCKKTATTEATAQLVSSEIQTAPNYSNSLETKSVNNPKTEKKKYCASKCSKAKASL